MNTLHTRRSSTQATALVAPDAWHVRWIAVVAALGLAAVMTVMLSASASAAAECSLTVEPVDGSPGTEFVFMGGEGADLATLTFSQPGQDDRVAELDEGVGELRLVATEADAGRWTVVATFRDSDCTDEVAIRVTLPPTATALDGTTTDVASPLALSAMVGLGLVFLVASLSLGRRRLARS